MKCLVSVGASGTVCLGTSRMQLTVSDETSKVSTDNAVPCCALAVVELGSAISTGPRRGTAERDGTQDTYLLLDVLRNVLAAGQCGAGGGSGGFGACQVLETHGQLYLLNGELLHGGLGCARCERFTWLHWTRRTHQLRWPQSASRRSVTRMVSGDHVASRRGKSTMSADLTWAMRMLSAHSPRQKGSRGGQTAGAYLLAW